MAGKCQSRPGVRVFNICLVAPKAGHSAGSQKQRDVCDQKPSGHHPNPSRLLNPHTREGGTPKRILGGCKCPIYGGKSSPSFEELLWSESWWRKSRSIIQRSQQSPHEASSHLPPQSRPCQLLQPTPQVLPWASFQRAQSIITASLTCHPSVPASHQLPAGDSSLPTPSNNSAGIWLPVRKGTENILFSLVYQDKLTCCSAVSTCHGAVDGLSVHKADLFVGAVQILSLF